MGFFEFVDRTLTIILCCNCRFPVNHRATQAISKCIRKRINHLKIIPKPIQFINNCSNIGFNPTIIRSGFWCFSQLWSFSNRRFQGQGFCWFVNEIIFRDLCFNYLRWFWGKKPIKETRRFYLHCFKLFLVFINDCLRDLTRCFLYLVSLIPGFISPNSVLILSVSASLIWSNVKFSAALAGLFIKSLT